MDKAVLKKEAKDKERAERAARKAKERAVNGSTPAKADTPDTPMVDVKAEEESDDVKISFSGDEGDRSPEGSPGSPSNSDLKRKREEGEDQGSPKRTRTGTPGIPPPPPPPPGEGNVGDGEEVNSAATESAPYSFPVQLETPPMTTNGSCDPEGNGKEGVEGARQVAVEAPGGS
jgi:[histone H3]-lysine36 N-trimethyltransferase